MNFSKLQHSIVYGWCEMQINGFMQNCSNSIANALELLQSCAKPWLIYFQFFIRTIVNCYSVPLYLPPLSHTIMQHLYKLPHILWGQWAQCLYSMNNTVVCHNNVYHCGIVEVGIQFCLNFIWSLYGGGVAETMYIVRIHAVQCYYNMVSIHSNTQKKTPHSSPLKVRCGLWFENLKPNLCYT